MYVAVLVRVTIDLDRIEVRLVTLFDLGVQLRQTHRNRSARLNADTWSNTGDVGLAWSPLDGIMGWGLVTFARLWFQVLRVDPIKDRLGTRRSKKICLVLGPGIHVLLDPSPSGLPTRSNKSRAAFSAAISSIFAI